MVVALVASGKIIQFNGEKGYGFIQNDFGGEDVFVHANSLVDEKTAFQPGVPVSFDVVKDARGLKAVAVRLLSEAVVPPQPAHLACDDSGVRRVADETESAAAEQVCLCDVLTTEDFRRELLDLCVRGVPSLTGEQIDQLSRTLIELACKHGWVTN
jgi:cold shock protein